MLGVFATCPNGHDLTEEGAYIYVSGGSRTCRQCLLDSKTKAKKKPLFDMFRKD